ncbi:hypothetical protein [Lentibacillus saliphilus]|uniref:hypothetical protein n=1 Tax=Lentibacillus saliphilus TaxID=2737028 RepID=UPI001C30465D|nr:hypothetical protein [Lentibacillus saliphilus]
MDHAIAEVKERMLSTIDLWQGRVSKEEIKPEIVAYVKAINELEKYLYGKAHTDVETVLCFYK